MQYSRIIDLIVDLEAKFPVDSWSLGGLHVWPLLRIHLYSVIGELNALRPLSRPRLPLRTVHLARRISRRLVSLGGSPRDIASIRRAEAKLQSPFDALFYSLTHARTLINGHWYDRHCDPLIEILRRERGLRSLLLESAFEVQYHRPRENDELTIDVDPLLAASTRRARGGVRLPLEAPLADFGDFLRYAAERLDGIDTRRLTIRRLARDVRMVIAVSDVFERLLTTGSPRVCFVVCYYHLAAMALIRACRRIGIRTVDVQHGMQANPAYSQWTRVPSAGYELLPEIFWTWTASDAEAIEKWASATNRSHEAVVGGYPWLETFRPAVLDGCNNRGSRDLRSSARKGHRILFSMPTFEFEVPAWVLEGINRSPADWQWLFRLHPRQLRAREKLKERIAYYCPHANCEIDAATNCPLPTLLGEVDVHVTHSSSVIIEAEYFGVRTVAIDDEAGRSFPNQASSGVLMLAQSSEELLSAIDVQAAARTRTEHRDGSGVNRTRAALDLLLNGSREGPISRRA